MESSSVEPYPCPVCSFPGKFNFYVYPEIVIDFEASRNEDGDKNLWRLSCRCSETVWIGQRDTIIIDWNARARNGFVEMTASQYVEYRHYYRYGIE
jgi:hypothetical protein